MALTLQECDDLRAAGAVMANTDDGLRVSQLVNTLRNQAHGDVLAARTGQFNAGQLHFPGLANVEQQGAGVGGDKVLQLISVQRQHGSSNRV